MARMAAIDGDSFMLVFESDWSSWWCQDHYLFQTHKDQDQPFTGQRSQTVWLRLAGHQLWQIKTCDILILISVRYTQQHLISRLQHLHTLYTTPSTFWLTRPTLFAWPCPRPRTCNTGPSPPSWWCGLSGQSVSVASRCSVYER